MDTYTSYSIHDCSKISTLNIQLKQKCLYLKRKTVELQGQIDDLRKEESPPRKPLKSAVHKHVSTQTEYKYCKPHYVQHPAKADVVVSETDVAKTKKVLEMHSNLLQRYDKEVKLNMTYADTISDLNVRLGETEQKLRQEKEKSLKLEREIIVLKGKKTVCEDPVLRDVVQERNKLAKENKRLKDELKGLDHNFFDEIEDLKFALLQSAKLNNGYEKVLHKMCLQFGLPLTTPETILHKTRSTVAAK